jgi:hypothetical protein
VVSHPTEFFNQYCERWWQGASDQEDPSGPEDQGETFGPLLMTYIELSCLDLATKFQVSEQDLGQLSARLLASGRIGSMPQLPVWLYLDVPQPVFGSDPSGEEDPWAGERVAAVYFRAPYSTEVLSRALIPPIGDRPFPKTMQSPLWFEWRLDLVDPQGTFFSAMQYYYDQRTGIWRKMEGTTCPWDECSRAVDAELGYEVVLPCPHCQETMDYYSRWLATFLQGGFGQRLHLRYAAWELRKRAFFGTPTTAPSPLPGRRVFKGKVRRPKKKRRL